VSANGPSVLLRPDEVVPGVGPEVVVPPLRVRLLFWLVGKRVAPRYRPWVAAQVMAPGWTVRRMRGVFLVQIAFVALPQLVLAATTGGWRNLLIAAFVILVVGPLSALSDRLLHGQRHAVLAYHGVTPSGQLVQPVSPWQQGPWTSTIVVLLIAVLTVLSVGVVLVVDRYVSPDRCQEAPAPAVSAVEALLGRTRLTGGPPSPPLFTGGRLEAAQRVDSEFAGLYYLSAYVTGVPGGEDRVGPAVWRVIEPGGVFPAPDLSISAADEVARELTPTAGLSTGNAERPDKARACTREISD